jgi:sugar/nucleoside kinase (ribokinase family)
MAYILYFGHVNIDVMLKVENFGNLGESREVKEYERRVGGTAYNAYKSLIALGVPAKIFSVIGPEIENLDGYFVRDKRNPTCWIITNGEEQIAYIYQGLWKDLHEMDVDIPVDEFEWLHFSTGNPKFYLKIARKARAMGKKISFDPSQEIHYVYDERTFNEMLSLADMFFCNEREYEKALQLSGEKLFEKIIVRTEGKRGASLYLPNKGWKHFEGISVKVIDTTGTGDTFRAAFYAALYRGHSIEEAIKYGNLAAAKVVESRESFYTGTWEELEEK